MTIIEPTPESTTKAYAAMRERLKHVKPRLNRPLTLTEKILYGHLDEPKTAEIDRGTSYLMLRPDRVVMQDATAQMAVLQFMQSGMKTTAVPTTIHCDHLIQAKVGAETDLRFAMESNKEVYDFLASAAAKYGMGFWKPGAGIIHQVVLEQYAVPGQMVIGTDSHTPNAGGLGMWASGVGGADAVDVMAGFPWEVLHPKIIGVKLTGKMSGWTAPKDVILKLCGILTVKGGTNAVIEYFGPGCSSISATGKATITNMGAEVGATTSIFPYDARMATYLKSTGRANLVEVIEKHRDLVVADAEVEKDPAKYFDEVVEIDLSKLEPHLVGPHTPDLARPIGDVKAAVATEKYPDKISVALVGSCTNSSYEDISRVAELARAATKAGLKMPIPFLVTPGSEQVRATIERDGLLQTFKDVGATVLANACGPCIGQWERPELKKDETNTIVTSFNRNFPRRNDGNANTLAFMGSPEITFALGLAGHLGFNPLKDSLNTPSGKPFKLPEPSPAPEVPPNGFVKDLKGYQAPTKEPEKAKVVIDPNSERLAVLAPFPKWPGQKSYTGMPLLFKTKGKCTTDHISPAGKWLRLRGHLDRISDNLFNGVTNAFGGEAGKGKDLLDGTKGHDYSKIARHYKSKGLYWVGIGDENYGEGSSREHAAMEPRWLNGAAIIARSFARIHETNLKKQGLLPLVFADPTDYEHIQEDDRIDILGLDAMAPGKPLKVVARHKDGTEHAFEVTHSLNKEQIAWFKAGSALNAITA
jgi:aconitate hydratase